MMSKRRRTALLLLPLVAAAVGTQGPAAPPTEIVVEGLRNANPERTVASYVRTTGVVFGERPVARWIDPICPQVIGVPATVKARVESQVRATVAAVGAPVAKQGCRGNFVIAFTDDAGGLVQTIAKRQVLGDVNSDERKVLETGSAPIRWWRTNETRNADGSDLTDVGSPALVLGRGDIYGNNSSGLGPGGRPGSNSRGGSLIATPTIRAITHATVVVDVNLSSGKRLNSIVDLATLAGLAEIRMGASDPNSILSLFETGRVQRLTNVDMQFLKALYALQLARRADQHRRSLITTMLKAQPRM